VKVQHFLQRIELPVSAAEAFAYHERPGALDRLIPPWENVSIVERGAGIRDGSRVVLINRIGPVPLRWVAEHCDYQAGRQFRDIQRSGPFPRWEHTHRFISVNDQRCVLEDDIEYVVPGGVVGRKLGGRIARQKIESMFSYRHCVTADDLELHAKHREQGALRVAVTGSHGLIGGALVPLLTTGGHQVKRLVRDRPGDDDLLWDPDNGSFDLSALEGYDAVVHLAGENIAAGRWTAERKMRIRDSRVVGTRHLCEALSHLAAPPKVLVSASAIGIYGDRGDETLDEQSPAGKGFLADVTQDWEAAAEPAVAAGIRTVLMRLGMVLCPRGGALSKMLTLFRVGAGGVVGGGRQIVSWIARNDAAGAIYHLLMTDRLSGPVNVVSPQLVTNASLTKTLGRVLSRPTVLPLPRSAARLAFGEFADEVLLASTRVKPRRLLETGYTFRHTDLEDALRNMLGQFR